MNDLAVLVSQYLKFDVPRMFDEFLGINIRCAKGLLSLAARRLVSVQKFFLLVYDAHTPPAAARGSFDDQRKSNFLSFFRELLFSFDDAIAAGHRGHAQRLHFPACAVFFSHHLDHFGSRADECNFRGFADLREIGVFGKESVTRMDGVHISDFCRAYDLRNIQVTLAAPRRANAHRFIRKAHMQRIPIGFGIHRDGRNPQFFAGTDDPQRDFPAIGY
jgi:hypothetical protein